MRFQEYLQPESVAIDRQSCTKTAVLAHIAQLFHKTHPQIDEDILFGLFWEREQLGSTAIGHGTAIPHIRCPDLSIPSCACLRLEHPIDFGGLDRQPIDLFIALIVPEHQVDDHLELLKEICEHLNRQEFRQSCRKLQNAETLFNYLCESQIAVS